MYDQTLVEFYNRYFVVVCTYSCTYVFSVLLSLLLFVRKVARSSLSFNIVIIVAVVCIKSRVRSFSFTITFLVVICTYAVFTISSGSPRAYLYMMGMMRFMFLT